MTLAVAPKPAAAKSPSPRARLRVLVLDDDAFQHDLLDAMLGELGVIGAVHAESAQAALDRLQRKDAGAIDLILLDLYMPGSDGFRFMESLVHTGFRGALIIVTGLSDDVRQAASLVARLRRFRLLGALAKPVQRAELAALLDQLA